MSNLLSPGRLSSGRHQVFSSDGQRLDRCIFRQLHIPAIAALRGE